MQKLITIDGVDTPVTLARRKGTRHLKITLKSDGSLRLSVPYGVPEFAARQFLKSKRAWINQHVKQSVVIKNGDHIGKNHRVVILKKDIDSIRTRVTEQEIIISLPLNENEHSAKVQSKLSAASEKALKKQSQRLLPQRIELLSKKHNLAYNKLDFKKLKSRWGACSNRKDLSFNIYLMQLEWPLIDYVILHELAHTEHQHHQSSFWELVEDICPEYKSLRKELKTKPVSVNPNT